MSDSETYARRGAVFGILATLLLANPFYIGLLVDQPRERSPTGYRAVAVNPTDTSDQQTIISTLGNEQVLELEQLAEQGQSYPYNAEYRKPDRAATLLYQAQTNGTATTTDSTVAFTLNRLAANHRFVVVHDNESAQYYRLITQSNNGTTIASLKAVGQSTVSWAIVYHDTRLFTSLPEFQRETVRKVLTADEYGYRPYNDEFRELTDTLLLKQGTYYLFQSGIHVDDFGFTTQTIVKLILTIAGTLSLLVALFFTERAYRR